MADDASPTTTPGRSAGIATTGRTDAPRGPSPDGTGRPRNSLTERQLPRLAWLYSLSGAVVVSGLLFALAGWSWGGFLVVTAIVHLVTITAWTRVVEGSQKATNALWNGLVWCAFLLALIPLVSIVYTVLRQGLPGVMTYGFFGSDMVGVTGVQDQASVTNGVPVVGGIKHALIGSVLITLMATLISVPIGLLTSIYLIEYSRDGWFPHSIRLLVDVMTGIPSIVAGLFAAAAMMFVMAQFNGGTSGGKQIMGFTASLALSVLMIPVVVRTAEEMLRVVPNELREAAYAMGVRKWRTILHVVIPTAISGIASGVTLAIARVVGETAPILVTAGFAQNTNTDLFKNWMMSLPVYIYTQLINPTAPSAPGPSSQRAWGAALVLIVIVMVLNLTARMVARFFAPKTSGR